MSNGFTSRKTIAYDHCYLLWSEPPLRPTQHRKESVLISTHPTQEKLDIPRDRGYP